MQLKGFVAVTDRDWFEFLSRRPELDEANFWQPGGKGSFRALGPNEPFLFKLHAPDNVIAGGGFFSAYSRLPASLAWETFEQANGANTLSDMQELIAKHRHTRPSQYEDDEIGCIILRDLFFFAPEERFPPPPDFHSNIVRGKTYDLSSEIGKQLWDDVLIRLRGSGKGTAAMPRPSVYGEPVYVRQRLGQGAFRILITDRYQRRCAITGEKILPVLQAAHILPVSKGGEHRIDNGLLLRSDVHTLFDKGYITVTPRNEVLVSRKLKDKFHNGEYYRQFAGRQIALPLHSEDRPNAEFLERHADEVFLR